VLLTGFLNLRNLLLFSIPPNAAFGAWKIMLLLTQNQQLKSDTARIHLELNMFWCNLKLHTIERLYIFIYHN